MVWGKCGLRKIEKKNNLKDVGSKTKRGIVFCSILKDGWRGWGLVSVVWNTLGDGTQAIFLRRFAMKQSREVAPEA